VNGIHFCRLQSFPRGALLALALAGGAASTPAAQNPPAAQSPPAAPAAATPAPPAATPAPPAATPAPPAATPAPPAATPAPPAATPAPAPNPTPATPGAEETLSEVIVDAPEPRFVAKTTRDRIGRIWAPVLIDGKGPFRLVLDTGANHSAVIPSTAAALGTPGAANAMVVTGFTGSAVVPTISVSRMEVGDLMLGPTTLPVVADVFGGAQGVLGNEGLAGRRIVADFSRDHLEIYTSHSESAHIGFSRVPLKIGDGGLLIADVKVGGVHCKAVIDTGAQGTVGNLQLRDALMRHPRDVKRTEIVGVTLDVQTGDSLAAPSIEMGGLTISGVRVTFGDMYLFEHYHLTQKPVLLLGMDLLGSFDVLIIDYKLRELQIRLTRGQL
jgi:predicted aspartyl protease